MRAARCLLLWAAVSVTGWSTASRQWRERGGGGGGIGNGEGDGRALREGEITRPQRLHQRADPEGGELAHGRLDTRARSGDADAPHPVHLAQLSFLVKAFGTSFILDLELNHDLLSSDYVERHFDEDRTPFDNQGGEHCYYHGTLRGVKGSWVALATCHGLWGMFSDGNFSYEIEPLPHVDEQGQNAHVVYRLPNLHLKAPHCPECNATTEPDSALDDDVTALPAESDGPTFTHGLRRVKRQIRRPPRTVQTETKYIELLVVNDYDLFVQLHRSTALTRNFAKAIVNMADAIYKEQLNTRLVLVAMETWSSQNMVSVGDDPLMTLRDFMKYRRENIKEKSDAAHLFS
ncbi:disintegrin and metalloproteinase domain-containing protein 11-like isoform X2, partial [Clarias magur]